MAERSDYISGGSTTVESNMTADETIDKIQKELRAICHTGDESQLDDWLWDHLRNIQWAISDYRNREFKKSEPDPFS